MFDIIVSDSHQDSDRSSSDSVINVLVEFETAAGLGRPHVCNLKASGYNGVLKFIRKFIIPRDLLVAILLLHCTLSSLWEAIVGDLLLRVQGKPCITNNEKVQPMTMESQEDPRLH